MAGDDRTILGLKDYGEMRISMKMSNCVSKLNVIGKQPFMMSLIVVCCFSTSEVGIFVENLKLSPPVAQGSSNWRGNPSIHGVRLGHTRSEVTKLLGKGRLVFISPDYVQERESRYEWKTRQGVFEVGFDQDQKVIFVSLSSRNKMSSPGGIRLNEDTVELVKKKLGNPDRTEGPTPDEEIFFYSLVYLAGHRDSQELHFVSYIDAGKRGLEPSRVTAGLFAKRPIEKVFISRRSNTEK